MTEEFRRSKPRDASYVVEQNRMLTTYYQCVGYSKCKGRKEKEHAWSNIATKPILTLPKNAREAATFMKNTGLLREFKATERDYTAGSGTFMASNQI